MKREEVLMYLVRAEADFERGSKELAKLREALQADLKGGQHTEPEDFRVEEPSDLFRDDGPRQPPPQPEKARNMADMVTPKQLGMIRALAREAGTDPQTECRELYGDIIQYEELSKRAASGLIDHLKELGSKAGVRRA